MTTLDRRAAETIAQDLLAPDEGRALLSAELLQQAEPALAERLLIAGARPSRADRAHRRAR